MADVIGQVPSSSGGLYNIRKTEDGHLICECKGYQFRSKCRHIEEFKQQEKRGAEVVFRFQLLVDGADVIVGKEVELSQTKIGDLSIRLTEVEEYLSRLLGLKVKIEQVG